MGGGGDMLLLSVGYEALSGRGLKVSLRARSLCVCPASVTVVTRGDAGEGLCPGQVGSG